MDPESAHAPRPLFGTETEYAVTASGHDGRKIATADVARRLLSRAGARPTLPGQSGVFLSNGGRFYIDRGDHPEYASPEATNPIEAVRYALAGDRLVRELAGDVMAGDPSVAGLAVYKGNVDYMSRTTWASHENYLRKRRPGETPEALVSHLITRIVITGGGGFEARDLTRARFVLSPRAGFLGQSVGLSSEMGHALVDLRTRPYCAGFHRQHLVCGDANRSHLSLFLRLGTTALVLALIDMDRAGDLDVALADPMRALRTVARDTTLAERLDLRSGERATAIEVQRHFLNLARRHRDTLPDWTDTVCDAWRDTLDRLAAGPEEVADRLDWAIKRTIFRDRAARRRSGWVTLDLRNAMGPRLATDRWRWRTMQCEIDVRYGQIHPPGLFDALDEAGVLGHRVPGVDDVARAVSVPPADGRARVRGEVVARLSGQALPAHQPDGGVSLQSAVASWESIRDVDNGRLLDLSSPFASEELWRDIPPEPQTAPPIVLHLARLAAGPPSDATTGSIRALAREVCDAAAADAGEGREPRRHAVVLAGPIPDERAPDPGAAAATTGRFSGHDAIMLNNHAVSARVAGRLEDAEWLMRASLAIDLACGERSRRKIPHRRNNLGAVLVLQGRVAEGVEEIGLAWRLTGTRYDITSARILTIRLAAAFVAREPVSLFIGQLRTHMAIQPLPDFADVDRQWRVGPLFETLAPRIDAGALDLLKAIGDLSNGERSLESMLEIPRWRDTPPVALDAPW
jgi:proteasome accessory factor A